MTKRKHYTIPQLAQMTGYHRGSLWRLTYAKKGKKPELKAEWIGETMMVVTAAEARRFMTERLLRFGVASVSSNASLSELGRRLRKFTQGKQ